MNCYNERDKCDINGTSIQSSWPFSAIIISDHYVHAVKHRRSWRNLRNLVVCRSAGCDRVRHRWRLPDATDGKKIVSEQNVELKVTC